jgi:hypothetical protein
MLPWGVLRFFLGLACGVCLTLVVAVRSGWF